MSEPIVENREAGKLYSTDSVPRAAVLCAAGHEIHRFERNTRNKLVFVFPMTNAEGESVHDTIRSYANYELKVVAKKVIDIWMELRDLTRNKEFARKQGGVNGSSQA